MDSFYAYTWQFLCLFCIQANGDRLAKQKWKMQERVKLAEYDHFLYNQFQFRKQLPVSNMWDTARRENRVMMQKPMITKSSKEAPMSNVYTEDQPLGRTNTFNGTSNGNFTRKFKDMLHIQC